MTLRTASLLTLWGFMLAYAGAMGALAAVNIPVISGFQRPVLYALLAVLIIGVAVMLVGRLAKVKEDQPNA